MYCVYIMCVCMYRDSQPRPPSPKRKALQIFLKENKVSPVALPQMAL